MAIDQLALIDLLTNLRNQAPPSISPDAGGGGVMDMMQRSPAPQNVADPRAALMQQAFAPRTPELVPEEPQWGKGRQIGSQIGAALADALGAYAAGLGSPVRVNASQQLMDRIRMGQASRDENARRKKSAEDEATQAKARYELGRMEQADAQKRQDERFAQEQAARKDELLQKQAFDQAELDRRLSFEERQNRLQAENARDLAILRGEIDTKVERMRQAGKSDVDRVEERAVAKEQRQAANEVMAETSADIDLLPQALAEGKATPDAIRNRFLRGVRIRGLEGEQKQRALEFFRDNVEPILMQFDPVQGAPDNPNRQAEEVKRAEQKFRASGGDTRFGGRL